MDTITMEQPQLPAFAEWDDEQLATFAARRLGEMETEAREAQTLSQTAFQKAWTVGKACVVLKERIGADKWEAFARENIREDYWPVYRCMRLARMSPDKPPLRSPAQFKQLLIALRDEPEPKKAPRKIDQPPFVNLVAAVAAIKRWWRGGDVAKKLDKETLREVLKELDEVQAIRDAIRIIVGE